MVGADDAHELDSLIEQFFLKFDELLDLGGGDALLWVQGAPPAIQELDDWALCKADALLVAEGPRAAIAWLEAVLLESPGFADAHYRLAEIYELVDDLERATEQHLETLRLDLACDELSGELGRELLDAIARVAADAIAGLADRFKSRIGHVPVFLDARPSAELVRDGYDSRSLGLFSGPNWGDWGGGAAEGAELTAIRLYVRCLWDAYGLDETELLEQVKVTVLHEIGHYFGLDEQELESLGLG